MTYLQNELHALGQVQSISLSILMIPGAGFVPAYAGMTFDMEYLCSVTKDVHQANGNLPSKSKMGGFLQSNGTTIEEQTYFTLPQFPLIGTKPAPTRGANKTVRP